MAPVRTHVALLRGVNVGGHNRLPMAQLRAAVATVGSEVATYVQSGNAVFCCQDDDVDGIAAALGRAVAERTDVRPGVVVLTREQLRAVVAGNPYADEQDPTRLHVVFSRERPAPEVVATVAAAEQRARDRGSRDEATVTGGVLYLHTPDGLGRSLLADELARPRARTTAGVTTMRNWATTTRLLALLDG